MKRGEAVHCLHNLLQRKEPSNMALLKIKSLKNVKQNSLIQKISGIRLRSKENKSKAPSIFPEMVNIPGGKFIMGSFGNSAEQPVRKVRVSTFAFSKYKITNAQYRQFLSETGKDMDIAEKLVRLEDDTIAFIRKLNEGGMDGIKYSNGKLIIKYLPPRLHVAIMKEDSISSKDKQIIFMVNNQINNIRSMAGNTYDYHPVTHVFWIDGVQYCEWLSAKSGRDHRLPTDAEWEYAAGGRKRNEIPGKKARMTPDKAMERINANVLSVKIEQVSACPELANPFGLHDIAGKAYELTSDYYSDQFHYDNIKIVDPEGPDSGNAMVVRGSSFIEFPVESLRAVHRIGIPFGYSDDRIGFRIVQELNRFEKFKVNLRTIFDDVRSIVSGG